MKQFSRHSECGVTLIEIIVVVAILGAMLGMAVTMLTASSSRVRADAYNLKSALMGAKSAAIKQNEDVQFNFDAVNDAYNATYTTSGNIVVQTEAVHPTVDLVTGNPSTTFTPLGTATNVTVNLVGQDGKTYVIRVNSAGRVYIQ